MTQVQTMTNPELNRALAELMGWTVSGQFYVNGAGEHVHVVVNWHPCTDPAASLEVQTKAIEINPREYVRNLQELKWECSFGAISKIKVAELMTATPREMAEAALITMMGAK